MRNRFDTGLKSRYDTGLRNRQDTAQKNRGSKGMLNSRLLTAAILLPLCIFLVFTKVANGLPAMICTLIVMLLACYEIYNMIEKKGYRFYIWINSAAITLNFINFYLCGLGRYDIEYLFIVMTTIFILLCLILLIIESTSGHFETSFENIGFSL
jgi:CDP-diglyceride synthetase